jgi:uncharacterized protein YqgC (DUF456 family)
MDQNPDVKQTNYGLIPGLVMIFLGLLFLLWNFDFLEIGHRWWALFFLIPISFMTADMLHRRRNPSQQGTGASRGSLIGIVTLSSLMVIFLFDMRWSVVWPIFIIIGGLSVLLSGRRA